MHIKFIYLVFLLISLVFIACGKEQNNRVIIKPPTIVGVAQNSTIMEQNQLYKIQQGISIVPISLEPIITIETNLTTGETTAQLINGEAEIVTSN